MAHDVEQTVHRIRLRLIRKIQTAELMPLESVGRAQIYSALSTDLMTISEPALMLTLTFQSLILLFFGFIYIAMQSLIALVFYVAFMAIAALLFRKRLTHLDQAQHATMAHQNEMMGVMSHLLDGFREVKMNKMRRSDLDAH